MYKFFHNGLLMLMCFVPIQDSLRGWLAFTAISKQVNVRKLRLSLSLLADPPIFLGSVRMISMRSQANLRKLEAALRPARQMDRFRRTIHLCNFIDLGCWFPLHLVKKSPYWWLHSHPPWKGPCHHWKSLFPGSTIHHIYMSSLDHSLIAIHL